MKLPKVLIRETLEWDHDAPTYRLVVKEVPYGYYGLEYVTEKLSSMDAMGNEIWVPTETQELSLVMATIGQAILKERVASTPSGAKEEEIEVIVPGRGLNE